MDEGQNVWAIGNNDLYRDNKHKEKADAFIRGEQSG